MTEHCTCRSGRDYDGSEFGPCPYCERKADEERAQAALIRDAARWRISQIVYSRTMDSSMGFFTTGGDGIVYAGIQPHPVTKATGINHCIMGSGKTKGEAIDGMFASLSAYVAEGKILPQEIQDIRLLFEVGRGK